MNKLIVSALALGIAATAAMAQGDIVFSTANKVASILDTTGDVSGQYQVGDLLGAEFTGFVSQVSEFGLMTPLGQANFVTKSGKPTGGMNGEKVTLEGYAGGSVINLIITAADQEAIASDFTSGYWGDSAVFAYTLGVPGSLNPAEAAGKMAPEAFGVTYHTAAVPEPTTIALGVLGLGALALIRRRK